MFIDDDDVMLSNYSQKTRSKWENLYDVYT